MLNRLIVSRAKKVHATAVCLEKSLVNKSSVTNFHRYGLEVFAWTANTPEDIALMKESKVDGIISAFPDRINLRNASGY